MPIIGNLLSKYKSIVLFLDTIILLTPDQVITGQNLVPLLCKDSPYILYLLFSSRRDRNTLFISAMQNLAAITNLPGYVGGLNPEQQFRFAQATGAAAVAAGQTAASSLISDNTGSNLGGIWPGIQQSPVNMVPFQIPSIKLESSLS